MAAELKEALGIDATLKRGHSGVYDVVVDGELIYSKYREGRFPGDGEVLAGIRERAG